MAEREPRTTPRLLRRAEHRFAPVPDCDDPLCPRTSMRRGRRHDPGNLETARLSYRDIYAESQMIVPGAVLQASNTAKSHMNAAYGKLKRYGAEPSAYLEELGSLEDELHQEVWIHLGSLKVAMRSDLGIDD